MATGEHRQRLAAILAADVASYSRLMAADDRATVDALDDARGVFRSRIEANHGRVIDMAGDSVLAVFESVTGALNTAIAVQTELALRASAVPEDRRMRFRIGVHLGDVIEKSDGTIYGDGVNIAARLEGIAQPGGIAISQPVHDTVRDRMTLAFVDMGEHEVKNIARPVRAYFIGVDGGSAPSEPAVKAPRAHLKAGNLPVQTTRFLGRAQDLGEVIALLDSTRLVTLTGVGGIGKTRLAMEAAAQASTKFPDGVWMVEFASVGDPSAVCHAVAGVIGVAQQGGKTIEETVVESIAGRRLLMVLDNCEHLIEAVAALANAILASCAQVALLATSREALMVDGEQTWPVPPLSFREGNGSPAVELFVERAHAVAPDFKLGENGAIVSDICQRLDGIPLAIELAAARVRSMSPVQIRDRLGERFRLLTGGARRALERHQTLRHAVQWSYDLLSSTERTVLSRASVFAGGFTLEAAEYVCSAGEVNALEVLDTLDSLVRKSLIFVERSDRMVRYGLLETIRQFGEEQLAQAGEGESTRRVHAQCYADDSGAQFMLWRSARQLEAYEWLDREMGNLRVAFRWAIDAVEVDIAARIASNIGDMARYRVRDEASGWAAEIVDQARIVRHRRLVVLLNWAGSSAWAQSRFDDARRYAEEAIALAGDGDFDSLVWSFVDLAYVASSDGDLDHAIDTLRIGSKHPSDRHDRYCLAVLLYFLAVSDRTNEAIRVADDIVRRVDAAGVPCSIVIAYAGKGAALEATNSGQALAAYEHSLAIAYASGNRFLENLVAPRLAMLQAQNGDHVAALQGLLRLLESCGAAADIVVISHLRVGLIVLLARLGGNEAAATLNGTLSTANEAIAFGAKITHVVSEVREALGDAPFADAARRGAAMAFHEANSYALSQIRQALASLSVADAQTHSASLHGESHSARP